MIGTGELEQGGCGGSVGALVLSGGRAVRRAVLRQGQMENSRSPFHCDIKYRSVQEAA